MPHPSVIGVDIGSVAVSVALLSPCGDVVWTSHRAHRGKPADTLREMLGDHDPVVVSGVAFTSVSPAPCQGARRYDPQVALVAGCRRLFPDVRSILSIGGERFTLVRLDASGRYRGSRTNSSCAAGTGSFLDQQARRLGLPGIGALVEAAMASTTEPARISTRCAVFARTDLVHAQQEGYSLPEICEGLCRGLALNIADTLFKGETLEQPVVCAGGVARNGAVVRHLSRIIACPIQTHADSPVMGAIGAALCRIDDGLDAPALLDPESLLPVTRSDRQYFYAPLVPAVPPTRRAEEASLFSSGRFAARHPVEVELYRTSPGAHCHFLGIDIGSTSTKAILTDGSGAPVAGFYARTLGSPLTAVQALCESIEEARARRGLALDVEGVAATGAGRKLVGALIGADLVVDEISAHARAAYALDPGIDTIIEIGGQDAKFTTMRDGVVTFSHMNTVCAAGTGSFLEEQAERLGCRLSDYEERVQGARAPLSSDRCAVFMERDINNFLAQGYATKEILAAALYSVRENYLTKVARGAAIGERIAFQGATARNRALVEAFRQGLGKPILVSRYCHLTGAMGAALLLIDQRDAERARGRARPVTRFVGLAALRDDIPVRTEVCDLCGNHCRLHVAEVAARRIAHGMLCGRDYDVARFAQSNRSGFDLLRERRTAFEAAGAGLRAPDPEGPTVGIPAALGLYGRLPFWTTFFRLLGIRTVTSEGLADAIDRGREVQGAEFCAPLAAFHGHVRDLASRADLVFLPTLLDEKGPADRAPRVQCYYTQYSAALAAGSLGGFPREKLLMPKVSARGGMEGELHAALFAAGFSTLTRGRVRRALRSAQNVHEDGIARLRRRFVEETSRCTEPSVVLLGRPYNVLCPEMSKGIPAIFGSLGIKTFFQDMVDCDPSRLARMRPLLDSVHWLNGARIIEVAAVLADMPNLYPVYVTSFKCSPDSFILEYFKRILDAARKPYLVLQLDDHDSTLGYETRIEAGVASFRNHQKRTAMGTAGAASFPASQSRRALPVVPSILTELGGRTLLYPCWDPMLGALLAANLRREGIDARLLHEDEVLVRAAMRRNTGQCLPVSIIAQEAIECVRRSNLDPARTALWMPASDVSCNIRMFGPYLKSLFEAEGGGMERLSVYAGNFYHLDVSLRATLNTYRAYLAAGLLRRAGCRVRPYETERGAADRVIARAMERLVTAFEGRGSKTAAMEAAAAELGRIPLAGARRPRVAVFGDLYVRDNEVFNQQLLRAIEEAGGEAVTTPYADYIDICARPFFAHLATQGKRAAAAGLRVLWTMGRAVGARYRRIFAAFVDSGVTIGVDENKKFVASFAMLMDHAGESWENLVKIQYLARAIPDLALFVQASPGFCCPSMVTEAMARNIERATGVPVVSITYDGTGRSANDVVVPYVRSALDRRKLSGAAAAGAGLNVRAI